MEMYQDGVPVMILPETEKCERARIRPLGRRECPLRAWLNARKDKQMAKCEYTIEIKVSDNEIKQICKELGGRALTEENLDKYSRTWRRILERVGEKILQTEQKEQRNDERF